MNIRTTLIASSLVAASFVSGAAHAALQGRDLNGSAGSFEAYYDTDLDITWLADANYAKTSGYDINGDGLMNWAAANAWAASLSFTDGVNIYDNWRLPSVKPVNGVSFVYNFSFDGSTDAGYNITSARSELAYMFSVNLGNVSQYTTGGWGSPSGCWVSLSDNCLNNTGYFVNLQPAVYWSDSLLNSTTVLAFTMHDGRQDGEGPFYENYAWAVHPGDIAAVPEAQTYALMLAGLGLIGWRARRRG